MRHIAHVSGLTKATVSRLLKIVGTPMCRCGKPITHRGMCSVRFAASSKRQALPIFKQKHKVVVALPPVEIFVREACSTKACVFPVFRDGKCKRCLAFQFEEASIIGGCSSLLAAEEVFSLTGDYGGRS